MLRVNSLSTAGALDWCCVFYLKFLVLVSFPELTLCIPSVPELWEVRFLAEAQLTVLLFSSSILVHVHHIEPIIVDSPHRLL